MSFTELVLIAVGLSMDAFAVAVCKGIAARKVTWQNATVTGGYFGVFQAIMPFIGYMVGARFAYYIEPIDHWFVFILLAVIGTNMIVGSMDKDIMPDKTAGGSFSVADMLPLAIATSIDALAVGISFAFLGVKILPAIAIIGTVTFGLSIVGVKIGHLFGGKLKSKAELVGGIILVLIGAKTLFEHLGFLPL